MVRPLPRRATRARFLFTMIAVLLCGRVDAGTVRLAWDPNVEADLAGYIISWGTQPGAYSNAQDVGNVVQATVPNLDAGRRYYFAVQAYNTSGLTSPYSSEVSADIARPTERAPTITAISPGNGPEVGGTLVTITGTGFAAGATVSFGNAPGTAVTVLSATTLTVVTPAHVAARVDVVVTVNGQSSAPLSAGYVFGIPPLTLRGVFPRSGPVTGGTPIVVSGTEFVKGAEVLLDGVPAQGITFVDWRTLRAQVPPHPAGPVAVTVRTPDGRSVSATLFTYIGDDPAADLDEDGLPDVWENRFGLDPNDDAGDSGPDSDPDGDGLTNLEELEQGTHPRGFYRRYFAEGVSTSFFNTVFGLVNPNADALTAVISFFTSEGSRENLTIGIHPRSRATLDAHDVRQLEEMAFSTTIESDRMLVAERKVTWDRREYGGHAETGIDRPATRWYFAEGATHSGFDLFYLLQNATDTAAQVEIRYLLPQGAPIVKTYTVPPTSRFNVWVDLEEVALSNTDVSAVITSTNGVPIIAERSMYLYASGQAFGAGHNSAGLSAPATQWFLAEGATGAYFDMFVLIANPGNADAAIRADYLLPDGRTITKHYTVAANSRFNIWLDLEGPELADTAVSTTIESTNGVPVIVERSMWWPGGVGSWIEAHNAPGATGTSSMWAVAGGEEGGPGRAYTYLLLANTSASAGPVRVTVLFEDGTTASREFTVAARSRFNVDVGFEFPEARGKRFGALVEALGAAPVQLTVECATYWDADGRVWAAGTNALGTPLRASETVPGAMEPAMAAPEF